MTNHKPSDITIEIIEFLREQFIAVGEAVERECPPTRERSLAITNLEQALMWAVASIARERGEQPNYPSQLEGQLALVDA